MFVRSVLFAAALLSLPALSACGFHPLYAQDRSGRSTAVDMSEVKINLIPDRVGQLTRNALLETLTPRGQVSRPQFTLSVSLNESTSDLGFTKENEATISDYSLQANYQLIRNSDRKVLRSGSLQARTSFNLVDSDFASLEAKNAARRDAARNLARQIANQVAVGLRSKE